MKRRLAVLLSCILLPSALFAKAPVSKIEIEGGDLVVPIEVTDSKVLADFNVWSGPGTSCAANGVTHLDNSSESFIVNWSRGVTKVINGLQSGSQFYQVSFYAKSPEERLIYKVSYVFDPATLSGYVYLPGRNEQSYELNVTTIFRGVEGSWFKARSSWDSVAIPLIRGAQLSAPK